MEKNNQSTFKINYNDLFDDSDLNKDYNQKSNLIECSSCQQFFTRSEISDHCLSHEVENGDDIFWEDKKDNNDRTLFSFTDSFLKHQKEINVNKLPNIPSIVQSINTDVNNKNNMPTQVELNVQPNEELIENRQELLESINHVHDVFNEIDNQLIAIRDNLHQIEGDINDYENSVEDMDNSDLDAEDIDELLSLLPSKEVNEKNKVHHHTPCIICLENFEIGEYTCLLPCTHLFHRDCIHSWLSQSRSCPICKFEISKTVLLDSQ